LEGRSVENRIYISLSILRLYLELRKWGRKKVKRKKIRRKKMKKTHFLSIIWSREKI